VPPVPRSDADLDRLLRQVRTPADWHARLADIAEEVDPLEQELASVPMPAGMHARLRGVIDEERRAELAAAAADDSLDDDLRTVVVPWGLGYRLRQIAERRPIFEAKTWRRFAVAAALFVMLAAWEGALFVAHYGSLFTGPLEHEPFIAASVVDVNSQQNRLDTTRFTPPSDPNDYRGNPSTASDSYARRPVGPIVQPAGVVIAEYQAAEQRRKAEEKARQADVFHFVAWATGNQPHPGDVRGAAPSAPLPDAARAAIRKPRGIDAKLNAGDRKFLLDYGVFPLVSTKEFPTSVVPLTSETVGYEAVRAAVAAGEWPYADEARPEDFLAATDFNYGRPGDKGARLYVAGAIAPWAPSQPPPPATPGTPAAPPIAPERIGRLLQLSVQARDLPGAARKPMHLTIGVDVTESMQAGQKLAMAKRALEMLVERLEANDRLTLVALGGANPVVIEDAGRAELPQILAAIEWLRADGGGNLAEGIVAAAATAARREPPKNVERRLVILSDSFDETSADDLYAASQFFTAPATRTLGLDLIDLRNNTLGNGAEPTAWDGLVRRRSGRVSHGDTTERMRSALLESLTGRNQVVAKKATLTVTFNPATVVAYRLVGHEPSAVAGLPPRPIEIDLSAGRTDTLLYELQLNGSRDQNAATAVLRWTDPTTGAAQEQTQQITRGTLGPAFDKSAPQLQLATIATATAARLRNSPWGDNVPSEEVLQWAVRLERSGSLRGATPWRELIVQMQRLPVRRTTTRGVR